MTAPSHSHGLRSLSNLGTSQIDTLIDFITHDDRPTFLLDIKTRNIPFCNSALDSLLQATASRRDFQSWAESLATVAKHVTAQPIDLGTYAQQKWMGKSMASSLMTVFCRWTPAPTTQAENTTTLDHHQEQDTPSSHSSKNGNTGAEKLSDMYMGWLEPKDDPWMSFVRNYPFDQTPLGPISSWHTQLRRSVQRMMVCPETRILYWGDQHLMIYNEAAVPILGKKHPCLGMPLVDTWGQVMYDQITETIKAVVSSGKAYQAKNIMFVLERDGFPEQTWHHFYQVPIIGPDSRYLGCVCEFAENTTAVVQENRAAILDSWIKAAAVATSLKQLWSASLDSLGKTSIDIVAGCVFSLSNTAENSRLAKSSMDPQDYLLEASFGVSDMQSRPSSSLLDALKIIPIFDRLAILRQADHSLPAGLRWTTPDHGTINTLCVMPITDLNDRRLAVAVIAMNPNRPFDDGSKSFMTGIADLLRKTAIFITLPEEQRKNEEITSALSDKLQVALLKAEKQEESYARMARQAPIGMYMLRPDGYPVFVNDAYLELHGTSRAQFYKNADEGLAWNPSVYEEDLELVNDMWRRTIEGKKPVQAELRFRTPTTSSPDKVRWVESMSYAERDAAGNVTSVQGWLLDVSPRKLTERLISEKLQDALETKRATETFLDMLSHEMRNPLSGILQLADGILGMVDPPTNQDTVDPLVDAAQTITLCARHMKQIIDEVLTFSKLDSNLLVLSLEKAQVPSIIKTALKMFEMEIEHAKITANINVDRSFTDLALDYVLVDPGRLLQVIINFLTNAIKFTKDEKTRNITIKLAASTTKPTEKDFGIAFLPPRKDANTELQMPLTPSVSNGLMDWTAEEELYIYIGVEDTGRGLTEEECKLLFQRFAQASPKTHKTYGGSGLGLFISRGLSELQGGQIGVKSVAGVGSTFGFYVKTRRAAPPTAPASRSLSIVSTEAMTDVENLPHKDGELDVQIVTKSNTSELSDVTVENLHILVCEDNAINQKVIAQQLRRLGVHTVHVADDGLAALNFLETTIFNPSASTSSSSSSIPLSLILMDVEMPVMDGLTCVRRIRELESKGRIIGHVPVIAITANARNEQVAVAVEAGMDEVVTKPFLVRELVPRMVALVQKCLR
ncbi:hypothetical protein D6D23_05698 [Aureobasidium pullulans]|nr:hypothetical protein D6D23_05698 [Aureobasidium pullulans]